MFDGSNKNDCFSIFIKFSFIFIFLLPLLISCSYQKRKNISHDFSNNYDHSQSINLSLSAWESMEFIPENSIIQINPDPNPLSLPPSLLISGYLIDN